MFTITWRVTKRQAAAAAAVFLLALAGGIWAKAALTELRGQPAQAQAQPQKIWKEPGKTNEQRVAFLKGLGWEIEEDADQVMDVAVPKEFDEVYENYNAIQQGQGCDLKKYAGKRCKRYTYVVTNYPGQADNVRANLLVAGGKIIGGDICSLELDGFMQGLLKGQET